MAFNNVVSACVVLDVVFGCAGNTVSCIVFDLNLNIGLELYFDVYFRFVFGCELDIVLISLLVSILCSNYMQFAIYISL